MSNNDTPENKDMTRKEEPTKAVTPDKLDRSLRNKEARTGDGHLKPYPLTEEEATPNTPSSEQVGNDDIEKRKKNSKSSTKDSKKKETGDISSDYNKLVSHPRKR